MSSVFDCANFFIYLSTSCGDEPVTNLRLNKLLWFAQGAALARFGCALFSSSFESWELGPVIPNIYKKYKYCGKNAIEVVDDGFDPNNFAPLEVINLLLEVANEYDVYSTTRLVQLSHEHGSPWATVAPNTIIPIDLIKDWFAAHPLVRQYAVRPYSTLPNDLYCPEDDELWEDAKN